MNAVSHPAKPKVSLPTLDSLSPSQIAAIRSIPAHDEFEAPVLEARRPASNFLDEGVYQREQDRVFRRLPVSITLSVMVREPGTVLALEAYGLPLLVTRDKQGQIHVFLNACQHKGSLLVETCEPLKASRVACPYHAWTYGLDGSLIGVPRQETFANFDKSTRGLAEFPAREEGGIVYAILNRDIEPDFSALSPQIAEDFTYLGLDKWHVYGYRRFDVEANWKLVLEPFLEGYHVQRLHASSVGPMFADATTVSEHLGIHTRQVSGKAHFTPDMVDEPGKNIHSIITHAYQLLPATVVVTSPYYTSVMIIMPDGVGKSIVDYFMLTQGPPDNPKGEELYARSYEMIQKVFGTEDFRAAAISQVGLKAGAMTELVYAGIEKPLVDYYKVLDAIVDGAA